MRYRVIAPVVVTAADGKSVKHFRKVGEVIDIPNSAEAQQLVSSGYVEPVQSVAPQPQPVAKPAAAPEDKKKS